MAKREILSISEKREICEYKERNMNVSQQHISNHFSKLWKKPVSSHCIGDILIINEKWINTNDLQSNVKRHATINGDIIREQAKILGQQINITGFEYSSGWLNRFKKQRGFSQYIRSGETAGADDDIVLNGRKKPSALVLDYKPEDIYKLDESGLFYSAEKNGYVFHANLCMWLFLYPRNIPKAGWILMNEVSINSS